MSKWSTAKKKINMVQQARIDFTLLNLVSYYALCLFAITFVVFMASTQSFVLTDILGVKDHVVSLVITEHGFESNLFSFSRINIWKL
jgi:hypothetical protein